MSATWRLLEGDVRERLLELRDESVQCVVTSPPYWGLRDYGVAAQIGLELDVDAYVDELVAVFSQVRRALTLDGTCWLVLGDGYATRARGSDEGWDKSRLQNPGRVQKAQSASMRRRDFGELKHKDLIGVPWMVAFALRAEGWWLRKAIVWHKPNAMPESVRDRPTSSHEYVFLLTRSKRYFYDADAVAEPLESGVSDRRKMAEPSERPGGQMPIDTRARANGQTRLGRMRAVGSAAAAQRALARSGNKERTLNEAAGRPGHHGKSIGRTFPWEDDGGGRNMRDVWSIPTEPYPGAHFATFPKRLVDRCVRAGSRSGDTVLDPFAGSGTTGVVSLRLGRSFVGIELNPEYAEMARRRITDDAPLFNTPDEEVPA